MNPLFNHYPLLGEKLPFTPLGEYPTPILQLRNISSLTDGCTVFMKRDDLCGTIYGGNKVRKLEFLLAEAKKKGVKRVITSGAAGSNHAMATAIYAKEKGLRCTILLFKQPPSDSVQKNLLTDLWSGAEIIYDHSFDAYLKTLERVKESYLQADGVEPFVIPPGGSSIIGSAGFVNAAFEFAEQIRSEKIKPPSTIYLPLGTMGTAAGLILGLKAAGVSSRVHAVRVVPTFVASAESLLELIVSTNNYLHSLDPSFPLITVTPNDFTVDHSQFGEGYGEVSREAQEACDLLMKTENIALDGVYSGKAFAALIANSKECAADEKILFWNTKNSKELPAEILKGDYHQLPEALHRYFQ